MTLSPEEISPADFRGVRHAHIEGYLVFNQELCEAVLGAARAAGCTISLDLSSFEVVNAARDWMSSSSATGSTSCSQTRTRSAPSTRRTGAATTRWRASSPAHGVIAAVKMGRDGAWIAKGSEIHRIAPVLAPNVVDTNGAGDAWAAGFLYGYLRGLPLESCGAIASVLGSETVRHLGPLIPDSAWAEARARALGLTLFPGIRQLDNLSLIRYYLLRYKSLV